MKDKNGATIGVSVNIRRAEVGEFHFRFDFFPSGMPSQLSRVERGDT